MSHEFNMGDLPEGGGESEATNLPNQSPNLGKLAAALAKAQGDMEGATKDQENPFFKSRYADLSSVWKACRGPLSQNGLAVIQTTKNNESGIIITTLLVHTSNEWISSELWVKPMKPDPQALGSALTYGRRYSLAAMVGISPEDDDGESAMKRKLKPLAAFQREAKEAKSEPELVNWWTNNEQEAMKNLSGEEYDALVETCKEVKAKYLSPTAPPTPKEKASKAKSTLSEYYEAMKAEKDRVGDIKYYAILKVRGMDSAADAKNKTTRDGALRALRALRPLPQEEPPTEDLVECPNTGDKMKASYCNAGERGCKSREGCPAFNDADETGESNSTLGPDQAMKMALELAKTVSQLDSQESANAWGIQANDIVAEIKKASMEAFGVVSKAMDAKKVELDGNVL